MAHHQLVCLFVLLSLHFTDMAASMGYSSWCKSAALCKHARRYAVQCGADAEGCFTLCGPTDAVQVISEYRKARALMADVAAQTKEGVWHNLFLEVEKVPGLPACRPPQNYVMPCQCARQVCKWKVSTRCLMEAGNYSRQRLLG